MSILIIAGVLISAPLLKDEEVNYFDKEPSLLDKKNEVASKTK
jgi:hypothetical protein